jgi:hypothetical protein
MKRLLIAAGLVAALAVASQARAEHAESAFENCTVVGATADARNVDVSTDRALRRLRRYIADHLSSLGGKSVGPTSTHCIRTACEASAIVSQH